MCMTPEAEMALYQQMDECADWGAAHIHLPMPIVPCGGNCAAPPVVPKAPAVKPALSLRDEIAAKFAFWAPAAVSLLAFALMVWGAK